MDTVLVGCHVATAPSPKRSRTKASHEQQVQEIRVCTNRACRKQGSFQTLETLSGIAPPNVAVKTSGCLGKCGAGPNLVFLPDGILVGYCGTAARCLEVMFGGRDDSKTSLDALALRKRADVEFENKNFGEAEVLLSKAIDLKPLGGLHVTFKCRSLVRLELGNYSAALQDANEALLLAPNYSEAYICQGDAFLAFNNFDLAQQSYLSALHIDPSIRRSKSFRARITKLQEKLAPS
ncbi:uncharacterized protein LOC127107984 [Lathyrus oleraceus]|uniref:Uncharacterized protein n=1 Tax=Pisum sativum TaxID=3888 RepID=A0A9D4VGL8_PEA|nr:uncharacterized protein LOC127107984 [Pisum sativum]KAI5382411.1 hypothetical protein KIW84_070005 [Pisum sativum]